MCTFDRRRVRFRDASSAHNAQGRVEGVVHAFVHEVRGADRPHPLGGCFRGWQLEVEAERVRVALNHELQRAVADVFVVEPGRGCGTVLCWCCLQCFDSV